MPILLFLVWLVILPLYFQVFWIDNDTISSDNSLFVSKPSTSVDREVTNFALKSLSINMTLNATEVVQNEKLGVNVSVTHNDHPIGDVAITLIYRQSSIKKNTTDFTELEKGIFFTALNTTELNQGVWKLEARVEKNGFETGVTHSQFSVIIGLNTRDYPSPIFLVIICLSIVIMVSAIISASYSLRKTFRERQLGKLEEVEEFEELEEIELD